MHLYLYLYMNIDFVSSHLFKNIKKIHFWLYICIWKAKAKANSKYQSINMKLLWNWIENIFYIYSHWSFYDIPFNRFSYYTKVQILKLFIIQISFDYIFWWYWFDFDQWILYFYCVLRTFCATIHNISFHFISFLFFRIAFIRSAIYIVVDVIYEKLESMK